MRLFRSDDATKVEPSGHFGGLTVADVVPRDVGENFAVQLSYCPPGGGGEMHSHADEAQLFLVMEGELSFDTGAERFTLGAEQGVLFEPGEQHATRNDSSADSLSVVVTVRRQS